jgi:hypothetical protein
VKSTSSGDPQISLKQISVDWDEALECWNVIWNVRNEGLETLRIVAVRLPHGQFKSDERRFDPPIDLEARGQTQFETFVRCNEPTGVVTENAFVIFSIFWLNEQWRIFVRLRVIVTIDGKPETGTELITTQKVGIL